MTRGHAAAERSRSATRVAYTAFGWVVLFFAFHVYWYLGGTVLSPGALPAAPHSLGAWIFTILVACAFPLGAWVCLAIAHKWARGRPATAAEALVWFGCMLLLARGGAGVIDDATRVSGLLHNGITGLTVQQTTGTLNPSAGLLWSGYAINGYFLIGGILFGRLALAFRAQRADARRH